MSNNWKDWKRARFREWLERVERADGEAGTVDKFLEKYFKGDR